MEAFTLAANARWDVALAARLAPDPAPLWVYDPDRAAVLWANPAGVERFAAPSLDVLRRRRLDAAKEVPDAERVARFRAAFERGEVVLDAWTPDAAPTLVTPVRLDDDRVGLLCRVLPPPAETEPSPKIAKLEAELKLVRTLFDTISSLILIVDAEGRISGANRAARARLGGAALFERRVWDVCGGPRPEDLRAWLEAGAAPSEPYELGVDTPSGRRQILWTSRAERDAGEQPYLLLSGVDTTALREAETRLMTSDRLASIGTLAAGLAHDLNNPLAFVITNAEVLQEELQQRAIDPELERMIAECLEGARRAASIVGQLQTFARGSRIGKAGVAHVRTVVDFAARMAHNYARHSARVEVECPEDLFVSMEESTLGQVVLNLFVHALGSIPAGHADRHLVRFTAARVGADEVRLEVTDDGEGLSPEGLRTVFDPYRSIADVSSRSVGLGLAISHRLVTEAGGRIRVDSAPGEGTTVQVDLRALPAPGAAEAAPPTPDSTSTARPPDGARILIVDDEERLRGVLRRMLRGYRLDGAKNGREALEYIRARRYDLVLCDVMMPEMTGPELYRALEAERPEVAARMIFLSGGAFTPETQAFLDETPRPVVGKPFRTQALRALIAETLAEHRTSSG